MFNYKKSLILSLALILFIVGHTFAIANSPESVWITPSDAKVKDEVTINAFVYNSQTQDVTFTVAFVDSNKDIQVSTIIIPRETAKTLTAKWVIPEEKTNVSVIVRNAVGKDNKRIAALEGSLGSIPIGQQEIAIPNNLFPDGFFKNTFDSVEEFRLKQAERYTKLRNISKAKVLDPGVDQVEKFLAPDSPDSPTLVDSATNIKEFPGGSSVNLVIATAAASYFSHKTLFYIASLFLLFFIIRFIFRLF